MRKEEFDVVIIGAGPSGAVAGAMLAQQNRKVLIIEKEQFPRFSIGESLLPQCMAYLAQAGMEHLVHDNAVKMAFQFKNGASFEKNGRHTHFDFTEKFSPGPGTTYQVKRANFDKLLADGAAQKGVEIRYGHTVINADVSGDAPLLLVNNDNGDSYQLTAKYLLDASGFGRVLPKLFSLESPSDFPVRQSYFTHVKDNIDCEKFDRNKILITVHPEMKDVWYWLIPFSDGTASVGVVAEPSVLNQGESAEEILTNFIHQAPNLSGLLNNAEMLNAVNTIKGYSANVSSLFGKNYALLGNAGEFLDPVFSSGVTIALKSATLIAPLVNKFLSGEIVNWQQEYSAPLQQGVDCFRTFVTAWYEGGFQDVIFYENQEMKVREMICSILAGYAWDNENPYVAQSERRFNVLVDLCRDS